MVIHAFIFFIFSVTDVLAQVDPNDQLTIENGLVNNEVTAIHQDKYGFLWFGTRGGLNKYDGYDFNVIRNAPKSKNNFTNQSIEVIASGKNGILWIGTKTGGLNSYDILKDSVTRYQTPPDINIQSIQALTETTQGILFIGSLKGLYTYYKGNYTTFLKNERVYSLKADRSGGVWIGSYKGVYYYHPQLKTIRKMDFMPNPKVDITSIDLDEDAQMLYMGTWAKGFLTYDIKRKQLRIYRNEAGNKNSLSNNNAYRVAIDRNKNVWIGTWGGGLNKFDTKNKTFKRYHLNPGNNNNRDYDIILSIQEDNTGIIWIGTDGGGVCKIDPFKKAFNNISFNNDINGLTNTHVLAIFEDDKKGLWVGTKGGGLYYSRNRQNFENIPLQLNSISVRSFFVENGNLWVGTEKGLEIIKDYHNKKQHVTCTYNPKDPTGISGPKITSIVKDKNNTIWVGTQENGLNKVTGYKDGKPTFKQYPDDAGVSGALQNERISCLLVDQKNRLWIGTYNGLHLYDRKKDNFLVFKQGLKNGLTNNTILCLAEDRSGNIWIGTQQGLNKLSFTANGQLAIKDYFEEAGFPNDYIHSVIADRSGNIWISTNKGITKLDTKSGTFRNFDTRDGLLSNAFSENAFFKSKQGEMFFGGIKGITTFYPDSIQLNYHRPPVYFTKLKVNNTPVAADVPLHDHYILTKALFATDKITLSYWENVVSLSFAALDFHASNKNQYAYKLIGFDKEWVNAGKRREITYTSLPAGKYTLHVIGSNSDQIWNKTGTKIQIVVLSPPWKRWWAYTIYILIITGLLVYSRYTKLKRINLKNTLEIAKLNYQQEHEIAEIKSQIFTNISHEFRTPLTLMIAPLDELNEDKTISVNAKKSILKIKNQANRVLSMVNQLLDFQKAQANLLKLNPSLENIISIAKPIYESFKDEALKKGINYSFFTNTDDILLLVDKDKIESIIYNLLSNAFKFTPQGASIQLSINFLNGENPYCELIVSDTGKGIKEEDKERIFDRFYQAAQAEPGKYLGTGIGLAFVKELVELHKGTITLTSSEGRGSTFKIVLPVQEETRLEKVQINDPVLKDNAETILPDKPKDEDWPLLLLIEDNEELNDYLSNLLSNISQVVSAKDGKDGLEQALQLIPDIIVSDVMMPVMDGYEVCKRVKEDKRTSHIPVILLTAKSDDGSHIKGLEYGADNYLPKPFNPQILISHVNSLLESRKKLKELFAYKLNLEPGEVEINSFDGEFIKNTIAFIEENLIREDLTIDDLASKFNMSRSTFYRKLKALTGMSGSEFIRIIRLKRSAQLLRSGEYSVKEAAYSSGFNDLKHFRTSFQKQYNVTPSEYLKKN